MVISEPEYLGAAKFPPAEHLTRESEGCRGQTQKRRTLSVRTPSVLLSHPAPGDLSQK